MNKEELLSNYASNLSNSKYQNHYLSYASDFLDHADGMDRQSIDRYISGLQKKKRSPGTVNFAFGVIRRLFTVNKLDWPYLRGQAPQITERDERRPALAPELIKLMIAASKDGKLHSDEECFLALSTTYGLRRQEITDIKPGDIDFKAGTLFISTVKHGRQRYHLIPAEIKPYLAAHDFNQQYSLPQMSQVFWRIVNNSGLGDLKPERLGWHSLRRSLLTGLIDNGLNIFAAREFLRWKGTTGGLAMPARYYSNIVIGLEGKKIVSEEAKGDKEVFEKYHPFLIYWRR